MAVLVCYIFVPHIGDRWCGDKTRSLTYYAAGYPATAANGSEQEVYSKTNDFGSGVSTSGVSNQ